MDKSKAGYILSIIILIIMGSIISNKNEEIEDLRSDLSYEEGRLDDCRDAVNQANENIDEANSQIDDAQSYVWGTYQEMGEALENLYWVDDVSF